MFKLSTVVILLLSIQNMSAQHQGHENKLESKYKGEEKKN
jgi:hypothetical protein